MKKLDAFRAARKERYQALFTSRALFIAGLIMMAGFLFNPSPVLRVFQFLLFWFFAWLAGKKNNPLITLLIILGIVIFNLLVPYGQVLFSIGFFKITAGALLAGIQKAVTLEGLIMLSRVSIRQDLRLPGSFGAIIGESFRIFEQITERKHIITRKNIIGGIDQLMIELSNETVPENNTEKKRQRTGAAGIIILVFAVILAWLPWVLFLPVW
ncbi:hypothetical protein [Breznakiella homolactica]|uniref:Energy-coupling factor transporter transmembrane protein EcfT n=1 Tax=Breznakiella homolactica TaxID=2798577 RepID=A0A7T7XP20_9SPIR|nr:hypothetical protein [Breznakiella homolactica]QQO09772.1 hypothetical protein JFL75_02350 [Breznakiella homolactica]